MRIIKMTSLKYLHEEIINLSRAAKRNFWTKFTI